mmetsp:Transcript_19358/g.42131  ORF Transcript_19358/g.42131 Transcript_19358/m.42131 type:complete len:438 (+) Transcript_19358:119-1432(+)
MLRRRHEQEHRTDIIVHDNHEDDNRKSSRGDRWCKCASPERNGSSTRSKGIPIAAAIVLVVCGSLLLLRERIRLPQGGELQPNRSTRPGSAKRGLNVAVAVLFTTGPKINYTLSPGAVDGAAVLLRSMEKVRSSDDSQYHIEYLAMITPEVDTRWIPVVEQLGYKARRVKVPIQTNEIRNSALARAIDEDGRLGTNEMAKIEPFLFTEYDRVLVLDSDLMFHRNFDELFLTNPADNSIALQWTEGYHPMEHMNGGFFIIHPKSVDAAKHYNAILDILRKGDYRTKVRGNIGKPSVITAGSVQGMIGWGGTGYGTTFGGRTMQGLLPYYFLHLLNGTASAPLDRCRYNNMQQTQRCKAYSPDQITSNHFTGYCKKPWKCFAATTTYDEMILAEREPEISTICRSFQDAWWEEWSKLSKEFARGSRCRSFVSQEMFNSV